MEHVLFTLVIITLLQLCRAQSNSTPEWYAANDINDTNFSPKPITELFSTETSFSPEDPIVVLSSSSSLPSNRGIVSSPTPIVQYSDNTDTQPPPSVIPLSSTELPPSPPFLPSQTTPIETQPSRPATTPQETSTTETTSRVTQNWTSNQTPLPVPRNNVAQNVQQNQPITFNRLPPQQTQPRNIQFLLPTQSGNRIFQGQQLTTTNGQANFFVLYEQPPQNNRNMPSANPPIPRANPPVPPQMPAIALPQQPTPPRNPQQQIAVRPPNMMRQQPQIPNQILAQANPIPPNVIIFPQQNNQQQNGQNILNQPPNINQLQSNPINNQAPVNQTPNIQQPNGQITPPPNAPVATGIRRRPLRQRNRPNSGRLNNRVPNRTQTQSVPCQQVNNTVTPQSTAPRTPSPVITIRLRPSTIPRNNLQINRSPNLNRTATVRPKQTSQENNRNYERCLNSCRDRKDRICAGPQQDTQINPDTLKGFPSMCHMACHNAFRANPIYEKIANGRCGRLRTRIQTVDKSKIRKDELKKSEYTIISNIPGTVVELAP